MIHTTELIPGVFLRCVQDDRFKQGCLNFQLVRPMCHEEAALNALIPAILLRGSAKCPDLRAITLRLDDLYGAAVGSQVRRIGDYQVTGLYCNFMDARYSLPGDRLLESMVEFLEELLLDPLTENGIFCEEFVRSEKRNLLSAIEAQRNDKRVYARNRLTEIMCKQDSFSVPRLGSAQSVSEVTAQSAWDHYRHVLKTGRIEIFYVGAETPERIAGLVSPMVEKLERNYVNLPAQTGFHSCEPSHVTETLEVTQGKLFLGFTTPITVRHRDFVPMQVLMLILSGYNGKLFTVIREQMSLCYDISATYLNSKGLVFVSSGIDFDKRDTVQQEVLHQLEQCQKGAITPQEMDGAKQTLIDQLLAIYDTPANIEQYCGSLALDCQQLTPEQYRLAVEQVQPEDVVRVAGTLQLHSTYFLKGVQ